MVIMTCLLGVFVIEEHYVDSLVCWLLWNGLNASRSACDGIRRKMIMWQHKQINFKNAIS